MQTSLADIDVVSKPLRPFRMTIFLFLIRRPPHGGHKAEKTMRAAVDRSTAPQQASGTSYLQATDGDDAHDAGLDDGRHQEHQHRRW